jgi:4-amino-4-deoxy-L-arabinose transferase-like glycosyltransferase
MSDASPMHLDTDRVPALSSPAWKKRSVLAVLLLVGALLSLSAMGARPGLPGGLWIGLLGICLAAGSTLLLFESFGPREMAARQVAARELLWPALHASVALFLLWGALRLAVLGVIPAQTLVLSIVVPLAFSWWVGAVGTCVGRLGFLPDAERPLWQRHGFWLIVLTTVVYVPRLGSFGLIDPWETHYGEVAREILARDDWISLWWAQDGWFWSKPILNFWAQALSFSAFGVPWGSDQMLQGIGIGRVPQPEWAARLPIFLMALGGQQLLYMGMRAYVGRLAAFLGALVLATTPYWYLLAHQSMVDMAYVGPLCAAMGCLLLALHAEPTRRVSSVQLRLSDVAGSPRITLSGYHLTFAALLFLVLPQVLYLVSRNLTLDWADLPLRLRLHVDQVASGSPGNCGLPGNAACQPDLAGSRQSLQPAILALLWATLAGLLLWLRRGERRFARLCYLGAWLLLGLSFMGKGAPGFVLGLATLGAFVVVRGRFAELRHMDLLGLLLITACVVMPWFVQEYLRHGSEFFERLFIHDMYQRAFAHVHDTNKGDDTSFRYYVWQLGYGLFPWSGLAAAGTLYCVGRTFWSSSEDDKEGSARNLTDVTYFCVLWQLCAFGMFSVTGTKFHHYILPLVPAVALLTGVLLGSFLERARSFSRGPNAMEGCAALGALVITLLVGRDLAVTRDGDVEGGARFLQLFTYNYARSWPATLDYAGVFWGFTAAAVVLCLLMLAARTRRLASLGMCALSLLVSSWAVNVYLVQISPHWGQRETLAEYYKQRLGPEEPLVAYQLNWKGENFYTGNNVPAFVASGKRFTDWVEAQQKSGVKVMFFTTEHSRVATLKRELGGSREVELLTNESLNDKFVLVRAVL